MKRGKNTSCTHPNLMKADYDQMHDNDEQYLFTKEYDICLTIKYDF